MCPECGSDNVRVVPYDFRRCPETGYHDAGEAYRCLNCGETGDAHDLGPSGHGEE
jgi:transposase